MPTDAALPGVPALRYLVTGGSGMLGTDLVAALAGRDVVALSHAQLDISNVDAVRSAVEGFDVVINAAAYTRVDDAESNEPAAAMVNAVGAGNLARATAASGALLVQISTDFVFDGTSTEPYDEDEPTHAISAYGRTKADGERRVLEGNPDNSFIVRTAWLYGQHGPNFVKTMLGLGRRRPEVSVVTDQVGQPTWSLDLAHQIVALVDSDAPAGTYHGTASGTASKFEFAREIFRLGGLDPENVLPTDSSQFVSPAPRPANSVLGHAAWADAGLAPMRDWRLALAEAFATGAVGGE
jgi:dTDP-4-dehydrorhamnose reductase